MASKKRFEEMRAISIRQPYVEQIFRGIKKYEYRSRPTKIRGKVYIYASLKPAETSGWKQLRLEPGQLPTGVIVGTVEIVDCKYFPKEDCYGYLLRNPKRLRKTLVPQRQPQPCWFFPF